MQSLASGGTSRFPLRSRYLANFDGSSGIRQVQSYHPHSQPSNDVKKVCDPPNTQFLVAFRATEGGPAKSKRPTLIYSPIPIKIEACWTTFDEEGVLGYGGSMDYYRGPDGFMYPVSLANMVRGQDLNNVDGYDSNGDSADADSEIFVAYSSEFDWYYGTDGNPPDDQVDFASVVLHEICHGLGFSGMAHVSDNDIGYLGYTMDDGEIFYPGIYDTFVVNGQGQYLTNISNPSL